MPLIIGAMLPGNLIASAIMVFSRGYFIYTGSVATIWPMFGTANQLLASIALAVGTSFIINRGLIRYAWITMVPFIFVGFTTIYAGVTNIFNIYIPQISDDAKWVQGSINLALTLLIMGCAFTVFFYAVKQWIESYKGKEMNVLAEEVRN